MQADTGRGSTRPCVFVSYAHADKEFVRQLEASLRAGGVDTFLDDRDIRVGDSIPQSIYDGISYSTHLVHVISAASAASAWVREELGIAKVREKQSEGYRILPIRIDATEPPIGLSHVKYADFRGWGNPDIYRTAFLRLFEALGVEAKLVGSKEVAWYVEHSDVVREMYEVLLEDAHRIAGALDASQSVCFGSQSGIVPHSIVIKWAIAGGTERRLHSLRDLLSDVDTSEGGRLAALQAAISEALGHPFLGRRPTSSNFEDVGDSDRLVSALLRVVRMLEELRSESEIVLSAAFRAD